MKLWMIAALGTFAVALLGATMLFAPSPAQASGSPLVGAAVTVVKSPTCGCCGDYVDILVAHGMNVTVVEDEDTQGVKSRYGVPEGTWSCHTAELAGYVVEGHVPIAAMEDLLRDAPDVAGIALPGMPVGSPGMTGMAMAPFEVVAFDAEGVRAFGGY